jgi:pimeloyl-ACP methyl ester carboxylesterase
MAGLCVIEGGAASDSQGPPLLFVHGACLAAWCWQDHFLEYFNQHDHRTFAVDLRGHGSSPGYEQLQDATIDDFVDDVSEVASGFAVPPVVIGHSMGGLIAQRFVQRCPVSGIVLLAPAPIRGMRRRGAALVRAHPLAFLKAAITRDMLKIYPDNQHVRYFMFSPETAENIVSNCRRRLQSESWRACMEMNDPVSPPLNISCPMLVLGGELDHTVPVVEVIETGKAYQAQIRIFSGVGHNLMLEASWQAVADSIHGWLQTSLQHCNSW